ncbi:uncharacterized protein LOC144616044 [Panthera onca]
MGALEQHNYESSHPLPGLRRAECDSSMVWRNLGSSLSLPARECTCGERACQPQPCVSDPGLSLFLFLLMSYVLPSKSFLASSPGLACLHWLCNTPQVTQGKKRSLDQRA